MPRVMPRASSGLRLRRAPGQTTPHSETSTAGPMSQRRCRVCRLTCARACCWSPRWRWPPLRCTATPLKSLCRKSAGAPTGRAGWSAVRRFGTTTRPSCCDAPRNDDCPTISVRSRGDRHCLLRCLGDRTARHRLSAQSRAYVGGVDLDLHPAPALGPGCRLVLDPPARWRRGIQYPVVALGGRPAHRGQALSGACRQHCPIYPGALRSARPVGGRRGAAGPAATSAGRAGAHLLSR